MTGKIPLTRLAPALRPELGERTPSYRGLYILMCDGVFDMEREPSGRGYFVTPAQIPAVAEAIRQHLDRRANKKAA
jgi:hypothetical protein